MKNSVRFSDFISKVPAVLNADLMGVEEIRAILQEGFDDTNAGRLQYARTAFAKFRDNLS